MCDTENPKVCKKCTIHQRRLLTSFSAHHQMNVNYFKNRLWFAIDEHQQQQWRQEQNIFIHSSVTLRSLLNAYGVLLIFFLIQYRAFLFINEKITRQLSTVCYSNRSLVNFTPLPLAHPSTVTRYFCILASLPHLCRI